MKIQKSFFGLVFSSCILCSSAFCQDKFDSIYKTYFPKIYKLPIKVNTENAEYSPVFDHKRQILYFVRQEAKSTDEKTYFITKIDSGWGEPQVLKIKKDYRNIAVCDISKLCDILYLYKNLNIYYSKQTEEGWSPLILLDKKINLQGFRQNGFTTTSNEDTAYFSRDGSGKISDIYLIKKINEKWGEAEKLDFKINSDSADFDPFIDSSGRYLFFSSKGHNSIGGYDIFVSEIKNGAFSEPVNLGYPINTIYNEVTFSISGDLKKAYYASERDTKNLEIFEVDFSSFNFSKLINWKKNINQIDSAFSATKDSNLLFVEGIYKINNGNLFNGFTDLLRYKKFYSSIGNFVNPFCTNTELYNYFDMCGQHYFSTKDYGLSITSYSNTLILKPNDTIALYNRGVSYFIRNDILYAYADIEKAISFGSNNAKTFKNNFLNDENVVSAFNKRALQLYKIKEYESALADINKVIEILPNSVSAYRLRAEIKIRMTDKGGACSDLKKCFELGDNSVDLLIKEICN